MRLEQGRDPGPEMRFFGYAVYAKPFPALWRSTLSISTSERVKSMLCSERMAQAKAH